MSYFSVLQFLFPFLGLLEQPPVHSADHRDIEQTTNLEVDHRVAAGAQRQVVVVHGVPAVGHAARLK